MLRLEKRYATTPAQWEPPKELYARSWTEEHARSVLHARKWRDQGGRTRQFTYVAIDVVLVCCNALLMYGLRFGFAGLWSVNVTPTQVIGNLSVQAYPSFLILYCSVIVLGCLNQGLYRTPREVTAFVESERVAKAVFFATVLLVLFIFTSGNKEISRLVVTMTGLANIVALSGWRYAKRRFVLRRAMRGEGQSRVLIVGAGKTGNAFASWLEHNRHLGYDVCGFLDPHPNGDKRVLGTVSDMRRIALAHFVDEVFVTLSSDRDLVKKLFLEARDLRFESSCIARFVRWIGLARAPPHNWWLPHS